MGNPKRHRFVALSIGALFLECLALGASPLSRMLVESANRYELEKMAALRGIAVYNVDDAILRERLLPSTDDPETIPSLQSQEKEEKSYKMTILRAQSMQKVPDGSLVTLMGNVGALIQLSQNEKEKQLAANKVIVDPSHSLFSAMGEVEYTDLDPDAPVGKMEGDIITYDWGNALLKISGGTTKTDRKNSDDEDVAFYTTGEEITYDTSRGIIFFKNGYITNNPDGAYSSITAKKLAVMDSGDMFMENAYLSIGRIPVLWLPFFLFPGGRMVGNPAIGFESERGWFVNFSFELYGSYPALEEGSSSSFTRLLESDDGSTKVLDGPLYRSLGKGEELKGIQKWAQQSESYMVLLADSYQLSGLVGGVVTENNLWNKSLSLKFDGRVATTQSGSDEITYYGSYPKTRYLLENEVSLKTSFVNLSLTMPLYSDPKVKRSYTNRFTRFSLDHLWGAEWPTNFTSEVTSYEWKLSGSLKLPSSWSNQFVQTLSLSSLEAAATYKWQKGEEDGYGYALSNLTLPSLKATVSGTLLSLSENKQKASATKTELEKQEEEEAIKEESEVTLDPLVNVMIESAFRSLSPESSSYSSKPRSLSVTYSLNESLTQTGASKNSTFDWDETQYRYNETKGSLLLSSVADPNWFTFSEELDPSYTITYDATKTNRKTRAFTLSSTTQSSIPIIGLSYKLTQKLYTFTETTSHDKNTDTSSTTRETNSGEFTKDFVTTHQLSLSKSIPFLSGSLSPSMTWILPPLTQSVTPQLTYKVGPCTFISSFKFAEQANGGPLEHDLITLSFALSTKMLSGNLKATYQTQEEKEGEFWYPFASQGALALKCFGFTFSGSYDYQNDNDTYGMHYFNSLTGGAAWGPFKTTMSYNGNRDALEKYKWVSSLDIAKGRLVWWRKRITFTCDLSSSLTVNYQNHYASNLSLKLALGFSIAEFLDVNFTMQSANTSFFSYYEDEQFRWNLMWEDLARSFDIFGDGIHKTNFNLSALGLEVVHHMADWTLNCKYTGSVVLSDNQFSWVPVISVFLQWKTLPELKVDENWTKKTVDAPWQETSSVYSE